MREDIQKNTQLEFWTNAETCLKIFLEKNMLQKSSSRSKVNSNWSVNRTWQLSTFFLWIGQWTIIKVFGGDVVASK